MRTGTSAPRLRISLTISKPFRPGSITSRMTRSTLLSRARANPSSPSWARITSCPSLRRLTRRPSAMARSSSMTRTRPIPGRCNAIRSGGGGQLDAEGGAFSLLALDLDAAAVGLDDALGDGEPEAGAFGVAGEQVVGLALEHLAAALQARPVEELFDHAGEALRFARELVEAFLLLGSLHPALAQRLGEETHAGQRGAELVRDVGDEVGLQAGELVGPAHLPDGEPETDPDAGVEQDEERDVPGAIAEGEGRRGIVARQLGGEREPVEP